MKHSSSGPSQRQLRVGEQLKHIIAQTLLRGHFSHAALLDGGGVTVTEVSASPDLKHATAFVVLGDGAQSDTLLSALNAESHVFQKEINRQANLKFTPRVKFKIDESFGKAERIEELLREIKKEN